jgi:hypothetical protein
MPGRPDSAPARLFVVRPATQYGAKTGAFGAFKARVFLASGFASHIPPPTELLSPVSPASHIPLFYHQFFTPLSLLYLYFHPLHHFRPTSRSALQRRPPSLHDFELHLFPTPTSTSLQLQPPTFGNHILTSHQALRTPNMSAQPSDRRGDEASASASSSGGKSKSKGKARAPERRPSPERHRNAQAKRRQVNLPQLQSR